MRILVVDDDVVYLELARRTLEPEGYTVVVAGNVTEALSYDPGTFDLVVSDYFMPVHNGEVLLEKVRSTGNSAAFIFLTGNDDLAFAVELMRRGADDYILKPFRPDILIFRVSKVLKEKAQQRRIELMKREHDLLDLENRKLVNWRLLYASKDVRHTEKFVENISRNVNQGGGFMWIDMLEATMTDLDPGTVSVPREVIDMVLGAGRNQRTIFDEIAFISDLSQQKYDILEFPLQDFAGDIVSYAKDELAPLLQKYDRTLKVGSIRPTEGSVNVDVTRFREILFELFINAIKFSPAGSPIRLEFAVKDEVTRPVLEIGVSNVAGPQKSGASDIITGLPYDFQELVFDMFFTIARYPEYLEEERWKDGTGLYIARRYLKDMGSWIVAGSGLDYTLNEPYVTMTIRVPILGR